MTDASFILVTVTTNLLSVLNAEPKVTVIGDPETTECGIHSP